MRVQPPRLGCCRSAWTIFPDATFGAAPEWTCAAREGAADCRGRPERTRGQSPAVRSACASGKRRRGLEETIRLGWSASRLAAIPLASARMCWACGYSQYLVRLLDYSGVEVA